MDSHNIVSRLRPRWAIDKAPGLLITAASAFTAIFSVWLYSDYRSWIALGTGGSPPTPNGYWRMTKIRINRFFSHDDLRDASGLAATGTRYLRGNPLPDRTGRRPNIVARTMPQRQRPVRIDAAAEERLFGLARKYCEAHPDVLEFRPSRAEGGSADAIYAVSGLSGRDPAAVDPILGDEIAHVHPTCRSLHVWLSEPDARAVVETGWGERFPLSAMGRVHPGFIFVYAPETLEDVERIERIVEAGIGFLTGRIMSLYDRI